MLREVSDQRPQGAGSPGEELQQRPSGGNDRSVFDGNTRPTTGTLTVPQRGEVAVAVPPKLTKEEISALAEQHANETGMSVDTARGVVVTQHAAQFRHEQAMTVQLANHQLLQQVHASGMDMVTALGHAQRELTDFKLGAMQAFHGMERARFEGEESAVRFTGPVTEETTTRQGLLAQFQAGKTGIQLNEAQRKITDLQAEHARVLSSKQDELQAKIQEQINATKDSNQKNALMALMTLSNLAQATIGGGYTGTVLTAVEMALASGATALAVQTAMRTISENPLVKGSANALEFLNKARGFMKGARVPRASDAKKKQ